MSATIFRFTNSFLDIHFASSFILGSGFSKNVFAIDVRDVRFVEARALRHVWGRPVLGVVQPRLFPRETSAVVGGQHGLAKFEKGFVGNLLFVWTPYSGILHANKNVWPVPGVPSVHSSSEV